MAKDRKSDIRHKAAGVFAEQGYDRASIRDVAKATDMSLAGLYYYYRGKDEILYDIQHEAFRTLLEHHAEGQAGLTDPIEKLKDVVRGHCRFFAQNIAEMKVMSRESEQLEGNYADEVNELRRRYVRLMRGIVEEIGPKDVPPAVATFLLFGMMNWLYTWYDPERDGSSDDIADHVVAIFLGGIR
ncbi:MAG: TetR/AcrR family transcriptional regulator [Planctomycetota bacterium]